jgi:hypothetical protein
MYKKIEQDLTSQSLTSQSLTSQNLIEQDLSVENVAEETPEVECNCPCGSEAQSGADKAPSANTAVVSVSVYWDFNGEQ